MAGVWRNQPGSNPARHLRGGPGGTPLDEQSISREALRAELCELVRRFCITHDTKIVEAILSRYTVTRRAV